MFGVNIIDITSQFIQNKHFILRQQSVSVFSCRRCGHFVSVEERRGTHWHSLIRKTNGIHVSRFLTSYFWRMYSVFINYCVFSLKFCYFSELCQFCCSASFLPAWCVCTHWHRGKTEKGKSPQYFKIFEKNTIFNEHPVQFKPLRK